MTQVDSISFFDPERRKVADEAEFKPSCVNCRVSRECIIAKTLRDFKGHIQVIGLHCMDWEAEIHE